MLNIKRYLLICLLLSSAFAIGQNTMPPVFEINADTSVAKIPDLYWSMYIDTSGIYSVQDIHTEPLASKLHVNNTKQTGTGICGLNHFWQRLRLKNNVAKEIKIVFFNIPLVDEYDLFIYRNDQLSEHYFTGSLVPYSKRDGNKLKEAITISIAPNEEILVYKHLYSDIMYNRTPIEIGYYVEADFIKTQFIDQATQTRTKWNWFIAGLLIFGFFINLFFFWISRETLYLYMSLLLFAEALWYLTLDKINFLPEAVRLEFYLVNYITGMIFWFLVTQFVRKFLKTSLYYPKWDKVILIVMISFVLFTPVSDFIVKNYFSLKVTEVVGWVWQFMFFALMTMLLLSFLFFKKEKDRLTNFSVIAAVPTFLLWSLGYNIRNFYYIVTGLFDWSVPAWADYLLRKMSIFEMFCVGWFAVLFTWIMLQRYALLRKQIHKQALENAKERNELITQQNEMLEIQVEQRTADLKLSIDNLKLTQAQLIQSEKMASLGELTAGIAHEIQNPLNFVNNFAEVSTELVNEMLEEIAKGNLADAKTLASDIVQNLEKINVHGKRADAIVKGMLQHSRSNSGNKEATDINALADEYLRLAYHGLRAKDKSFNATMKTDLDESIGQIQVVPQDIGRVILNLITNAFHAVDEKKKKEPTGFNPAVSVTTRKAGDSIEIKIQDNGNGIPPQHIDKIFQPFFTTKPTGQGTGLGLSMSYDIVKAHGGLLKVETKEGEGTQFLIILPIH